jgi:hypothetical protein
LGPCQFFQNTAQTDDVVGVSHFGQWRLVRAQQGEPVQDMRVAAKLPQRAHAGVSGIEIVQEVTAGALIKVRRFGGERSGERFSGAPKKWRHRVTWRRKRLPHDWTGGTGQSRWATARAYCSITSRGET